MLTWMDIVNRFIELTGAATYLEIGSGHHLGFDKIVCKNKEDIEPYPGPGVYPKYWMKSDDAFRIMGPRKYDVIFIDGLHECDQLARDAHNSLQHINKNGFIFMHDCLPKEEINQQRVCPGAVSWTMCGQYLRFGAVA